MQNCSGYGIEFLGGSNTTVTWNYFVECADYAVWLDGSTEFIEVKFNAFENNGATCQVFDDGDTNVFEYNYYSDWLTPDTDADKIVDVPYDIDGAVENSDPYPVTDLGYDPSTVTSNTTSPTTTSTGAETPDMTMTLVMVGGAVGVIVLVAGILVLKRR
jgi:hypothetical protein